MAIPNSKNLMSKQSPFLLFEVMYTHIKIRPLCHIRHFLIKHSLNDSQVRCCKAHSPDLQNQFNTSMIKCWASFPLNGIQDLLKAKYKEQRHFFPFNTGIVALSGRALIFINSCQLLGSVTGNLSVCPMTIKFSPVFWLTSRPLIQSQPPLLGCLNYVRAMEKDLDKSFQ